MGRHMVTRGLTGRRLFSQTHACIFGDPEEGARLAFYAQMSLWAGALPPRVEGPRVLMRVDDVVGCLKGNPSPEALLGLPTPRRRPSPLGTIRCPVSPLS